MEQAPLAAPDLGLTGILVGLLVLPPHLAGLLAPAPLITGARSFPRSRFWGTLLVTMAAVWSTWLTATSDLGEFSPMRTPIAIAWMAGGFLMWRFVPDFLSSRSLGFLLLLAAHPVMEATFLKTGALKLALVLLAYGWALAGLFLVGIPVLHRDLIAWVCASRTRWNAACWAGVLYGLFLLIAGIRTLFLA